MQLLELDSRENALVPNLSVINNKWKCSEKLTDKETGYLLDMLKKYPKFSPKLSPIELPNLLKDQSNTQAFRGELKYLQISLLRSFLISSVSKNDLTNFHNTMENLKKPEEIIKRAQDIVTLLNSSIPRLSSDFTLPTKKEDCSSDILEYLKPTQPKKYCSPTSNASEKKSVASANNTTGSENFFKKSIIKQIIIIIIGILAYYILQAR